MSILYLTPGVFDKGGISRYDRAQIKALRELLPNDQVIVASLLGPSNSDSDLETSFPVTWHGRSANAAKIDMAVFSAQAILLGIRKRPKVLWAAHMGFSGLAWLLSHLVGATFVLQVYGREVWMRSPYRPDVAFGFQRCQHIISDSRFTAEYVQKTRQGLSIDVVWDCVDTGYFTPGGVSQSTLARYNIPDPNNHFNILTLGRLSNGTLYKGYLRLLELLPALPGNARLIYGGGGDLIPCLKKRAMELGVSDRVCFTGFIDEVDLPGIYRLASVFCLIGDRGPGRGEGIPLTPLEAAACGVPILVGNQDGSREAIQQGVNGFALDPFDQAAIIGCLNELISHEEYRQSLGQAARARGPRPRRRRPPWRRTGRGARPPLPLLEGPGLPRRRDRLRPAGLGRRPRTAGLRRGGRHHEPDDRCRPGAAGSSRACPRSAAPGARRRAVTAR